MQKDDKFLVYWAETHRPGWWRRFLNFEVRSTGPVSDKMREQIMKALSNGEPVRLIIGGDLESTDGRS